MATARMSTSEWKSSATREGHPVCELTQQRPTTESRIRTPAPWAVRLGLFLPLPQMREGPVRGLRISRSVPKALAVAAGGRHEVHVSGRTSTTGQRNTTPCGVPPTT